MEPYVSQASSCSLGETGTAEELVHFTEQHRDGPRLGDVDEQGSLEARDLARAGEAAASVLQVTQQIHMCV